MVVVSNSDRFALCQNHLEGLPRCGNSMHLCNAGSEHSSECRRFGIYGRRHDHYGYMVRESASRNVMASATRRKLDWMAGQPPAQPVMHSSSTASASYCPPHTRVVCKIAASYGGRRGVRLWDSSPVVCRPQWFSQGSSSATGIRHQHPLMKAMSSMASVYSAKV